ncbi:MAG: type II toxin-antitoxin system RelE/ParE family toxin [Rhodocyclaceae bacterium]|nr:type II toxin-antitoxin system RelE/ParE family toxin [Rhodocyclaceae bacterium]
MVARRLEFTRRALRDIEAIESYYIEEAGPEVADDAVDAILAQDGKLTAPIVEYRPGIRKGTREYVMTRFPYTLVYLSDAKTVTILRVIHQRSKFFNRGA